MSAGYREIRRPGIRWLVLEGWEEKLPLLEWADGWESIRGAEIRKVSVKKTILAAPSAGEVFLIKVYHAPTFLRRLLTYRRRSPAFRDVELFRELDRRGVPLSLPVAAGERRAIGFQGASCLVVRPVGGAVAIDRLLLDREAQGTQRRLLLGAYGAFARQVHESGVLQEDFDPNNAICLSPDADPPEIELVDMERVSTSDRLTESERARNLARLLRYGRDLPLSEQLRFLRGYVGKDEDRRGALRSYAAAIRAAWPDVTRRDRERLRRACLRSGRLFAILRQGGVRGIHRVRFGEREDPIFDASHLAPAISRLRGVSSIGESILLEDPISTPAGPFDAKLVTLPFRDARRSWQEANEALKNDIPSELPLALLELRPTLFRRLGVLVTIRSRSYRPPSR